MRNIIRLSIAAAAIALPLAAEAADRPTPVRRAAPVVQRFNWTGVYIGASGGQVRGGSQNWISGIPLFCNTPSTVGPIRTVGPLVPFPSQTLEGAIAAIQGSLGLTLVNTGAFTFGVPLAAGVVNPANGSPLVPAGTGVGGCSNPAASASILGADFTPTSAAVVSVNTVSAGGSGLAPALQASLASLPTDAVNSSLKAAMYGFQVGYNHQFLQRFVGGFEADFHIARGASDLTLNSLTGAANVSLATTVSPTGNPVVGVPIPPFTLAGQSTTITTNFAASQEMRYFGTLRARLGWLPWEPVLIYATGGLAYARITSTTVVTQQILGVCGGFATLTSTPGSIFPTPITIGSPGSCAISPAVGTSTNWRAGITYGGGIEVALGGRVSLEGEYLYYSFGSWAYDLTPLTATTNGNVPFFTTGVTATSRSFNGSRWIVGLNYKFDNYYTPVVTR